MLTADDVGTGADLTSSMIFLVADNSAGSPLIDRFAREGTKILAPSPFVSRLAQRLLGHERGPLAVVGHVDRVWAVSTSWSDGREDVNFRDLFERIFKGHTLGEGMSAISCRYAALAAQLTGLLGDRQAGADVSPELIGSLWTAMNDARNYIVLGDPAVRVAAPRAA